MLADVTILLYSKGNKNDLFEKVCKKLENVMHSCFDDKISINKNKTRDKYFHKEPIRVSYP